MRVAAKTGVITDLKKSGTYAGFPAIPQMEWLRQVAYIKRLRELDQLVKNLERRVEELQSGS